MTGSKKARAAARLAAVQALYQFEMEGTALPSLLDEFHRHRLDKTMLQILRAGAYELLARADVPTPAVITEYVDVAHAFFEPREAKFVNGVLDAVGKAVR